MVHYKVRLTDQKGSLLPEVIEGPTLKEVLPSSRSASYVCPFQRESSLGTVGGTFLSPPGGGALKYPTSLGLHLLAKTQSYS